MIKHQKSLAKLALTALILASTLPVHGHAVMDQEAEGTYLAAGCPSGCPSTSSSTPAQNNSNDTYSDPRSYKSNMQPVSEEKGNRTISNLPADEQNRHAVGVAFPSPTTLTEAQLLVALDAQGRALYLSLDPEGKALAIQLASQDSYRDKNLAVKEALRRSNERQGMLNR